MSEYKQLELFPMTKEEEMEEEIRQLKKSCDAVRKKMFHENRELIRKYNELLDEVVNLRKAIYKYGKTISLG